MKKVLNHSYIVLLVFIAAFVIGSFYDYDINSAIFHNRDTFGLVVSVIECIPGYSPLSFIAGGLFYLGLKKTFFVPSKEPNNENLKKAMVVVFFICSVIFFAGAVYFSGNEFFGPNGFNFVGVQEFWGYFIALPLHTGIAFLGYYLTSKSKNEKLWIVFVIIVAAFALANLGGTILLKSIFHRPRFRTVYYFETDYPGIKFHNWWQVCSNYKDLMKEYGVISEEFKSFPSGHATRAAGVMMVLTFLPEFDEKFKKYEFPLFYGGVAWTLLVAFVRMYVGAHYLSDVSMGVIISMVCFIGGRFALDYINKPKVVEEVK